jgi:hypothetical protein
MIKKEPAWTFQGGRLPDKKFSVPGPGAYNPSSIHLENPPGCMIGKSSKTAKSITINPGPGSYSPNSSSKLSPRAT